MFFCRPDPIFFHNLYFAKNEIFLQVLHWSFSLPASPSSSWQDRLGSRFAPFL
jgi:hypothetical protein